VANRGGGGTITDDLEPFDEFDRRLREARGARPDEARDDDATRGGYGSGLQAGIDVFAGVIGGLLIGWALDRWMGTTPILLLVFLVLGAAAGLRNAYRTMQRLVRHDDRG